MKPCRARQNGSNTPDGGDPYEGARGELLSRHRRTTSRQALTLSELNFSDTVWSSVLLFESLAFEQSKTLTSEIEKDVVLLGDEERLRRMTAILLDNAMKYSGEGGAVTLRLQKLQEKAVLTVHNTGDQNSRGSNPPISLSGFTGWTAPAPVRRAVMASAFRSRRASCRPTTQNPCAKRHTGHHFHRGSSNVYTANDKV